MHVDEEYQVLKLHCLSMDNRNYKVRLEDGKIGFIRRDNKNVRFQTWEQHILSVFSVGFDESTNPLYETPSAQGTKLLEQRDQNYLPVQIKDEWLQVRWGGEEEWKYGWIRWRENQTLLIELFYFA
jgi:hypothetical protein